MEFNLQEIADKLYVYLEANEPAKVTEKNEIVLLGCPEDAFLTIRESNVTGYIYADIYYPQYDEGKRENAIDTWRLGGLPLKPTSEQLAQAIYDRAFFEPF